MEWLFKGGLVAVEAGLVEQRTWESPEVDPWVNWSRISHAAHGKQPCFKSNSLFNGGLFLAFLSIINHKGKNYKINGSSGGNENEFMYVCWMLSYSIKYNRQKKLSKSWNMEIARDYFDLNMLLNYWDENFLI